MSRRLEESCSSIRTANHRTATQPHSLLCTTPTSNTCERANCDPTEKLNGVELAVSPVCDVTTIEVSKLGGYIADLPPGSEKGRTGVGGAGYLAIWVDDRHHKGISWLP